MLECFLVDLEKSIRQELPRLNAAIEADSKSPDVLVQAFEPWKDTLTSILNSGEGINRRQALEIIKLTGFFLSSIERHYQSRGEEPGSRIARLPGVDTLLIRLGQLAEGPPRDTHFTYWTLNKGAQPLSFTGDPQEAFFNIQVNLTDELHQASCNALRLICHAVVPITSPEAVEVLNFAKNNTLRLYENYRSFMVHNPQLGHKNIEPLFFMKRMRTYLCPYVVGGELWSGPNAANIASQMQVDYLIGTVNSKYGETVKARFRYPTQGERNGVEIAMNVPPVIEMILERMKLTPEAVVAMDETALVQLLDKQDVSLRLSIVAYSDLVNAASRLTAAHWALIQNYLVKPGTKMSEEEKNKMAVRPDAGTGGKQHEDTKQIMLMRREHPIIAKLVGAVNSFIRNFMFEGCVPVKK